MNAATFRATRETCGIPQSTVAEALGVRARTVKNWERGETPIPLDAIEWIEAALEGHDRLVSQAVDEVQDMYRRLGAEPGAEPPVRLTYWRTQGEFERHGRGTEGSIDEASTVNAATRAIAQVLRDLQFDVEFAYWDDSRAITIDGDHLSEAERRMEGRAQELMGHGYSIDEAHDLVYGPKTLAPSDDEGWELFGTVIVVDEHSDDELTGSILSENWPLSISDGQARLYALARALKRAECFEEGYEVDSDQAAELLAVSMMMDDLEEEREAMELIAATTDPEELERLHEEWDERLEGFEDRWAAALDLR